MTDVRELFNSITTWVQENPTQEEIFHYVANFPDEDTHLILQYIDESLRSHAGSIQILASDLSVNAELFIDDSWLGFAQLIQKYSYSSVVSRFEKGDGEWGKLRNHEERVKEVLVPLQRDLEALACLNIGKAIVENQPYTQSLSEMNPESSTYREMVVALETIVQELRVEERKSGEVSFALKNTLRNLIEKVPFIPKLTVDQIVNDPYSYAEVFRLLLKLHNLNINTSGSMAGASLFQKYTAYELVSSREQLLRKLAGYIVSESVTLDTRALQVKDWLAKLWTPQMVESNQVYEQVLRYMEKLGVDQMKDFLEQQQDFLEKIDWPKALQAEDSYYAALFVLEATSGNVEEADFDVLANNAIPAGKDTMKKFFKQLALMYRRVNV